ncbi:DNA-binding NarL/FixJ family response regulator [Croceifilum oryzae]|uniref:DNA-binding NarL/FixJ family response regulator n=1 Tax=Croceifilum oryzae TaxID=1553429 RepID=A0AAJ1TGG8_9BACL|nr:response regulator transcription factor [Croceifilum oryzae]MDQ0418415.1 DNA-binding NarL/FixJ family response regulator [Croceifilum oryzae]
MEKVKLLLVDDQELIRESLHIILDLEDDFEVVGLAENGQDAVEFCKQVVPDVVLMDIHMPVLDGVRATQAIKKNWPHVRVIILTTFQEIQYVIDALTVGAEGYLLKAIHPRDLIMGIRLVYRGGTLISQEMAKFLMSDTHPNESQDTDAGSHVSSDNVKKKVCRYDLTERELQVLRYLSDGLSNKEIAKKLYLSEGTVKNYISNIYSKLDVKNRLHAAKKAHSERIL